MSGTGGVLRLIWRAVRASPFALPAAVAASLLQGTLGGAAVAALGALVDRHTASALLLWGALLLARELCGQAKAMFSRAAQDGVRLALGADLMDAAARLPYEDFERPRVLALLDRGSGVLAGAGVYAWLRDTLEGLTQATQLGATAAILARLQPWLAIPTAVAIAVEVWAEIVRAHEHFDFYKRLGGLRRLAGHLGGLLRDRGINAEARLHGAARWLIARWVRTERRLQRAEWALALARMRRDALVRGSSLAVFLGAFGFGTWLALRGALDAGGVVALAAGVRALQGAAEEVTYSLTGARGHWLRLMDAVRLLERTQDPPAVLAASERIVLRDVHYRYPGARQEALRGVTLELRRGELLAVVGPNGSGKSTLARVLLGLLPPTAGCVEGDGGADIRRSAVFQDFVRYDLTVRENVGLGQVAGMHDDLALHQAIAEGGAATIVAAQQRGLDTLLGRRLEGGVDLSGGQWQAIATARGIFARGDLIVFDEPTAALDPLAERAVFERFTALARGRFALILTHRMGAAALAGRVAVLRRGRVVEVGTHAELVAAGGLYARMWEAQAQWYR